MLIKCIYGGGRSCVRQGGHGGSYHDSSFVHSIPSYYELNGVEDGFNSFNTVDENINKSRFSIDVDPECTDDSFLQSEMGFAIPNSTLSKALVEYNLQKVEGVRSFLNLIPVIADDIIKEAYQTVFMSVVEEDTVDFWMLRRELISYFRDLLYGQRFSKFINRD